MPSNNWVSLSDSIKDIWDRLDDKSKAIILGYDPPTGTTSSQVGGASLCPVFSKPHFPQTFPVKNGTSHHLKHKHIFMRFWPMISDG
jgi:hypothetical protein